MALCGADTGRLRGSKDGAWEWEAGQGARLLAPALPFEATRWRTLSGSEARTPSLCSKPPSQASRLGCWAPSPP